jgi:hypothetical protein
MVIAEAIQTILRSKGIEGAYEIGVPYTKEEAEAFFDHMFNLRCSMSGRALWQLGTPLVRKFNGTSLNNCYFTNIATADDIDDSDEALIGHMFTVARDLARREGIAADGYRLIINCREHGGQEVYHLHVHLVGGAPLGPMISAR